MPTVCRALAITIAFDLTRRATIQASSHAARSIASGRRCDTIFHSETTSSVLSLS